MFLLSLIHEEGMHLKHPSELPSGVVQWQIVQVGVMQCNEEGHCWSDRVVWRGRGMWVLSLRHWSFPNEPSLT